MGRKALTTEEFIERAKKVHGDKYRYDKTVYEKNNAKVTITCLKHGDFEQTPNNHIVGRGCTQCAIERMVGVPRNIVDTEVFVQRAKAKHGDKYDYSKVIYRAASEAVTIICRTHGVFKQRASTHLFGNGCPECGLERTSVKDFLERAKEVYGDRYDYSKVDCKRVHDKVTIGCKKHGEFKQQVYVHLSGRGCPKCGNERKAVARRRRDSEMKVKGDLRE